MLRYSFKQTNSTRKLMEKDKHYFFSSCVGQRSLN